MAVRQEARRNTIPTNSSSTKEPTGIGKNLNALTNQTTRLARSLGAVGARTYTAWKAERYSDAEVRIRAANQREIDAHATAQRNDIERRTALIRSSIDLT